MGEWMSDQGVGLRLFVVWVAGTWACATGGSGTAEVDTAEAADHRETTHDHAGGVERARRVPEQVVQRIVAAPERSASGASASNGVRPAADTAAPSAKSVVEPITSKHLEAELNRLEAELRR